MSELRFNVVTKEWVIIAPERAARPSDHTPPSKPKQPAYRPTCPFCPGNESMAATEVMRLTAPDGSWKTRAIRNLFPILAKAQRAPVHHHVGLQHTVEGFGAHEVIIETPHHDLGLALLEPDQMKAIIETYRDRYNACRQDPHIAHVVLFKNHGAAAGTSLVHPHAQIVGTPVVSYQVRDRIRTLEDHLALYGECVLCRMLAEEIDARSRLLHLSDSFVAFIPYAALSRYHIWIFPRRHIARFGDMTDDEVSDLADTLRTVLRQLHFGLGDPAFNYLVRSAPRSCAQEEFHWYISIVPRIGQAAGFELGSGIFVNTSYPEDSASYLRSVDISEKD
ncbi:MAG TPA: galactose-1-phosphate uridylyltransferase [Polyangiaceae bacterium]|jgi:UDPglucose--hexose-1-phosphate uridylyltransferase|nr:MAG: Galactose-1-phosphate uridylyltransferase [Deltaproteobacteria bacterium ADurb.Bin207]HNZ25170.1 galactose-1-phosphate uridylyltransferase [Polyangiaceae bacterium]HOD25188.1 galactose-1-phosphate uridylyltransferase [Polyangiaceae bacterium]HOE50618.1 galactose-1-phosphate uridylyltransferase [Polyangiaceae bacterium]HOH03273.1 galactose-1-phosphate uridylyltransferase [Polyangiaceae bacterium]